MNNLKYKKLFEPIQAGGALFRNRIFASPEGFYNVGADNLPNLQEVAFFERKALGGAASVCIGDCIVDSPTGTHYPYLIRMDDPKTLPGLSAIASGIRRHGAIASAELSHSGMYASYVANPDALSYGPDASKEAAEREGAPNKGILYGPVDMEEGKYGPVKAMDEDLILHIIDRFGKAAAWAKRCGFGMVTIHGGHGWLLAQFMSPILNKRTDRWGGATLENRMRFTLAVVESVRKHVGPKFPIEIRISGSECDPGGYDISEGVKIAKALDGKVDILHISAGNHEFDHTLIITHPSMFVTDGSNVQFAAEIKKHVATPVATVGGLTNPAMMEEIIASGKADIVELGRQTLADPDLPLKARMGRDEEINKCMRCNMCFSGSGTHRVLQCSINPIIGRELETGFAKPAWVKKKVLVVGGGPGGMQAALTAEKNGHEVILCEKTAVLGGVLLCECKVPFKLKLEEYLQRQARFVKKANIEVRLNTEVTPEYADALKPDVIIAAIGARPAKPPIPGIDGDTVIGAEDFYLSPEAGGEHIVILGGGLVGLELGIFRAQDGHKVTVIEMMDELNLDPFSMHTMAIMNEMARLGIELRLSTRALEIKESSIIIEGPDGQEELPADTVVYATGQIPKRDEAVALSAVAPEFYQIGDCVAPRNILSATQEAYTIANDIGRRL
ncbi:MAG: FAD-dependent oxidoreductase [Clostridiales Family XIII bacterium]|jgi:2,4-dienoyl-CoA reductase-like NADH-dependent reductase (Old Yellow Enzyme family)/thioredoxin reductase|nr:FAD-dependent oxidoreductase [Clostridiales Family XIII bacterium]